MSRQLNNERLDWTIADMNENITKAAPSPDERRGWLEVVRRQVGSLRYGVVQIVVHDSQVTQIDKTERVRLESRRPESI